MSYHEICLIPDFFNDCSKGFFDFLSTAFYASFLPRIEVNMQCLTLVERSTSEGSGESSVVVPFFIIDGFFWISQVANWEKTREHGREFKRID